jgi:arylsulfatase A-like enzyme
MTFRFGGILTAALCLVSCASPPDESADPRVNVLFIAIDDLRPETGAYGQAGMITPTLDALAREGRLFTRHYTQVPTCGASRYALLTGQHPVTPASQGNDAFSLYQDGAAPPSLPEWFRRHGYLTAQIGKISHSPDGRRLTQASDGREGSEEPEVPGAWDQLRTPVGAWDTAWRAFFAYAGGRSRLPGASPATEARDVDDFSYPDGLMAQEAVRALEGFSDSQQPFFLAVGLFKPHLPFTAPKAYWDLYDEDAIALAAHRNAPAAVNAAISLHSGGEFFGNYSHTADHARDDRYARHLRHGYYAATSYVDAQVGLVLKALNRLGLRERTIVVVWGDHGYHLGEHGMWGKHTLHDVALRSALIVRTPDMADPGRPNDAIVSTVDLFPTLANLADLPQPDHVDGVSLKRLIEGGVADVARDAALGLWRMNGHEGATIRTAPYRYTRWVDESGQVAQVELYDHRDDPNETRNVASERPGDAAALDARLRQMLDTRKAAQGRRAE